MWLHSVHRTGSPVVLTGVEASDSPFTKVQQLSCGATLERMDRERRSILVCQLPRIKKMWNSSQCEFWNIVPLNRIYRYRKRHCSRALKRQNQGSTSHQSYPLCGNISPGQKFLSSARFCSVKTLQYILGVNRPNCEYKQTEERWKQELSPVSSLWYTADG